MATGNINQVIGGRAMQGFASGVGTVTGTLFLAEIAPKAIRGVLGAFFSFNIMLGVSLGYWVNYIAILHISPKSHWQWRMPVLFQLVSSISIYPPIMQLKESSIVSCYNSPFCPSIFARISSMAYPQGKE